MDEAQKTNVQETQIISTPQGASAENTQDGKSLVDAANRAAERIEKAIAEQKSILARQEEIYAKQRLGGRTEAGHAPVVIPEETPREYARKVFEGKIPLK